MVKSFNQRSIWLVRLQTFFTAGPNEVRAWTIKKNSTAPEAAEKFTQILNEDLFVLMWPKLF